METSQCCLPGTRRICFPDPKHSGPLPAISPTMLSSTTQHDGLLAACVSTYNTPGILGCTHVKMCAIAYTTTIVWWCLIDNRVFPQTRASYYKSAALMNASNQNSWSNVLLCKMPHSHRGGNLDKVTVTSTLVWSYNNRLWPPSTALTTIMLSVIQMCSFEEFPTNYMDRFQLSSVVRGGRPSTESIAPPHLHTDIPTICSSAASSSTRSRSWRVCHGCTCHFNT